MHEMAEFVEERHDLAVLHQSGVPCLSTGEVTHQHSLWKLPAADARNHGRTGEPFVLAIARVHIEIDAAQRLALGAFNGIKDVEGVN